MKLVSLVAEQLIGNEEITGWKMALKEIHAALNKQVGRVDMYRYHKSIMVDITHISYWLVSLAHLQQLFLTTQFLLQIVYGHFYTQQRCISGAYGQGSLKILTLYRALKLTTFFCFSLKSTHLYTTHMLHWINALKPWARRSNCKEGNTITRVCIR